MPFGFFHATAGPLVPFSYGLFFQVIDSIGVAPFYPSAPRARVVAYLPRGAGGMFG